MRKQYSSFFLFCIGATALLSSCRNDEYLAAAPPVANQSFVEQFDTMQNAYNRGWRWINRSIPIGPSSWTQAPGTASMSAYSSRGTNQGAAYADYLSTLSSSTGIISNWLISPSVIMQNGDRIIFYTKADIFTPTTGTPTDRGARMQVRVNLTNDGLDVGNGDDAGNFFTTTLLDINPNEDISSSASPVATAYPPNWSRFEAKVFGLNGPVKGRFAFRYYLHTAGGGAAGKGYGIGIDSVAYVSNR